MGGKKDKHKKNKEEETEEPMKPTQQPETEEKIQENQQEKVAAIAPKKVQYCPICTFPFELCKYGKKSKDCKKFLQEAAPTKVAKYHPEGNKEVEEDPPKQQQKISEPAVKKEKLIKQKYIVVDVKQRAKKKFVTHISGLQIFKIESKEFSKKLSKKFACSCSATDVGSVQVQGDFLEDVRDILIDEYKVKKKYILDGDQFKEKFKQEQEKKKQARKQQQKVIPEEPEGEDQPEPVYKTDIQKMLDDVDGDDDDN